VNRRLNLLAALRSVSVNDCLDCGKPCEASTGRKRIRCAACAKRRRNNISAEEQKLRYARIRARKTAHLQPGELLGSQATMPVETRICLACHHPFPAYMPAARYCDPNCYATTRHHSLRKDPR
jgi:protein-arginine kinase activator protein McsA